MSTYLTAYQTSSRKQENSTKINYLEKPLSSVEYTENAITEFELQAYIFTELKRHFRNVRGEYTLKRLCAVNGRSGKVDIAILDYNHVPRLFIEVKKSYSEIRANRERSTRQASRYTQLSNGVPCMYIRGPEQTNRCLSLVMDFIEKHNVNLDEIIL